MDIFHIFTYLTQIVQSSILNEWIQIILIFINNQLKINYCQNLQMYSFEWSRQAQLSSKYARLTLID